MSEPQTKPGEPLTEYDEELVRRAFSNPNSWPVPGLLVTIDELRRAKDVLREALDSIPRPLGCRCVACERLDQVRWELAAIDKALDEAQP